MKNKFYKKYKECYDCIKNENYFYFFRCPNSHFLPVKFQDTLLDVCNLEFIERLPKIFDKLFKHKKFHKK